MIKLSRAEPPLYLTLEKVAELTSDFRRLGKPVWNHADIRQALLESSYGKCAYCEAKIGDESKYLEVEHFEDKVRSPGKVVDWSNLLPACKRCNVKKGSHDVISEPIINPFDMEPVDHLFFRCYRLRGISELGDFTIGVLDLNNTDRLVLKRFQIGEAITTSLENALSRHARWKDKPTTLTKNSLMNVVERLLSECQDDAAYAATAATSLYGDTRFLDLVFSMKKVELWSNDMEEKHIRASKIRLG